MARKQTIRPDAFLRLMGFRIHSRPKGGRPTWERDGEVFSELEASHYADRLRSELKQREKSESNNRKQ